jgi:hypothetical protein
MCLVLCGVPALLQTRIVSTISCRVCVYVCVYVCMCVCVCVCVCASTVSMMRCTVCVCVCVCLWLACLSVHTRLVLLWQESCKGNTRMKNPSRSGDKKLICWFTKPFEDYYFEDYRSREGQIAIMKQAVADYPYLIQAAANPTNQWERNVSIYLGLSTLHPLSSDFVCY